MVKDIVDESVAGTYEALTEARKKLLILRYFMKSDTVFEKLVLTVSILGPEGSQVVFHSFDAEHGMEDPKTAVSVAGLVEKALCTEIAHH